MKTRYNTQVPVYYGVMYMQIEQLLMRNLMRAYSSTRRFPKADKRQNVTGRGYGHILDLLWIDEGISQQQIAEKLDIRQQSVSEAISLMEQQSYITKMPSPNDKRVTLIYITEDGIRHRKKLAEERRMHAQKVFSVFSEEEKITLLDLLEKLNKSLAEEGGDIP